MRWPAAGAVVASLAFAFGASAALRVQHIGQIQSLAFLMIAHWLLVRTFRSADWRDGLALGLSASLLLVGPNQVALLGVYVLSLQAIDSAREMDADLRGTFARMFVPLAIAGATAAMCWQVIPLLLTYLFVESTTRAEISYAEAITGSLAPRIAADGDHRGPVRRGRRKH
jgi:hypothetical protein